MEWIWWDEGLSNSYLLDAIKLPLNFFKYLTKSTSNVLQKCRDIIIFQECCLQKFAREPYGNYLLDYIIKRASWACHVQRSKGLTRWAPCWMIKGVHSSLSNHMVYDLWEDLTIIKSDIIFLRNQHSCRVMKEGEKNVVFNGTDDWNRGTKCKMYVWQET